MNNLENKKYQGINKLGILSFLYQSIYDDYKNKKVKIIINKFSTTINGYFEPGVYIKLNQNCPREYDKIILEGSIEDKGYLSTTICMPDGSSVGGFTSICNTKNSD
jgi:hypothetical protein